MIKGCKDKVLMECNIVPLGEFGKNYMEYSGRYWCECVDECREVYTYYKNLKEKEKQDEIRRCE